MKTLTKTILFLIPVTVFFSCFTQRPLQKEPAQNNATYKVEYLFEHDGCKVYRFYDYGHYVYFTNCQGETTSFSRDSVKIRITNQTYRNQ